MKTGQPIALNIVYLPDEPTRNKTIELSQKLAARLPTEYILNPKNPLPHITIYQGLFPIKNQEKVKEVIKQIASQIKPFEITLTEFVIGVVKSFVWWNCLKTSRLAQIQKVVVEKANPLREGLIPEVIKTYQVSIEEKNQIKKCGSIISPPHITISRLKNPDDGEKVLKILGEGEHSVFRVDRIALGHMGDHGTVTGIIESFPLEGL